MKKKAKTVPKPVAERNLFDELTEGMAALAEIRQGKRIPPAHVRRTAFKRQ